MVVVEARYNPTLGNSKFKLLNVGRNHKTIKGDKKGEYLTAIMYLASASSSGYNVCPMSTPGCRKACLNYAGYGNFPHVQEARIRKTRAFFDDRTEFLRDLNADITMLIQLAKAKGLRPAVRLNGTSDIRWENIPFFNYENIMAKFRHVQFYDYTKIYGRFSLPKNYWLAFSLSENNGAQAIKVLKAGGNVAVVFRDPELPKTFGGYRVTNGDEDDLRFLDPPGTVIGLKAKGGHAKGDTTGFVKGPKRLKLKGG